MLYIIFVIYLTSVFANSYEKYIDLLPEEEKQDFLDRVVRRIMENVKSKANATFSSEDISDEELKKHNDFVQTILKQESNQMGITKDGEVDNKNSFEEKLDVKPLRTREDDIKTDLDLVPVDLTFNGRRSYVETSKENVTKKNTYIQKRSIENSKDFEDSPTIVHPNEKDTNEVTEDTKITNYKHNYTKSKPLGSMQMIENHQEKNDDEIIPSVKTHLESIENITVVTSLTETPTTEIKATEVTATNTTATETSATETTATETTVTETTVMETPTTEIKATKTTITETTTETPITETPTVETFINATKVKLTKSPIVKNNSKAIKLFRKESTDKKIIYIKTITEKSGIIKVKNKNISKENDHLQNKVIAETTETDRIYKIKENRFNSKLPKSNLATKSSAIAKILSMKQLNVNKNLNTNNIAKTKLTISITSTVLPALTPTTFHAKTIVKPKIKLIKKSIGPKYISNFASRALKKVKEKYMRRDTKAEQYRSFIDSQNKNKRERSKLNSKHYFVYEIDWPFSKKKVLRGPNLKADQPHYVPIYDYSPNNAYFNPENRYGPNAVEEKSMQFDTYSLRVGEENVESEGHKDNKESEENIEITTENIEDIAVNAEKGDEDIVASNENIEKSSEKKGNGDASGFKIDLSGQVKKFALYNIHPKFNAGNKTNKSKKRKIHQKHVSEIQPTEYDEEDPEKNRFPDSDEDLHPFNSMKNGLKSHIKAVRQVLNSRGYIGEVQYKNKDKYKKYLDKIARYKLLRSHTNNSFIQFDLGKYKIILVNHPSSKTNDNRLKQRKLKKKFVHRSKIMPNDTKIDSISKIIAVTDEKDLLINLNKLRDMNMKFTRSDNNVKLDVYVNSLEKLVAVNSKALKQYDWLGTTVQIQSALAKVKQLLQRLKKSEPMHPSDIQLIKYMMFLHNLVLDIQDATGFRDRFRKTILQSKNKKHREQLLKEKGLIDKVWLYLRTQFPDLYKGNGIANLEEFILNIENELFDLHDAFKNIALVTKYNNQHWYENIKDLYLTTEPKQLLELLLHLSVSKLIDSIEKSCENGLEFDFVNYMKNHRKEAKRTLDETMFVVRILDAIKYRDLR